MRILRGLRSELLPCGCLAGVYETYGGEVVTLLDDTSPECTDPAHAGIRGDVPVAAPSTPLRSSFDRSRGSAHGRASRSD